MSHLLEGRRTTAGVSRIVTSPRYTATRLYALDSRLNLVPTPGRPSGCPGGRLGGWAGSERRGATRHSAGGRALQTSFQVID